MLVDSHCHLDRLQLDSSDGDLDRALDAARNVGVEHFLCVGIDRSSWPAMLDCVGHREDVSCSVGVHPNEGDQGLVTVGDLLAFAAHKQVVAIGETGLDYHYGGDRRKRQQETFRLHVEAARVSEKPLIVHSRAAKADTLEVLRDACAMGVPGVLHCFTEDWDMARQALDLGYYISFSGIVTFRSANELREVAQRIPMDGMLLETDSPWLAPVPNRGKPNQPAWVREVAACIAALRGIALEELAEATTSNFFRLFREAPGHSLPGSHRHRPEA
jgi:TatD DNase family protein